MHRLFVILAILLAVGSAVSPGWASARPIPATAQEVTADEVDCRAETVVAVEIAKTAGFRPCAKKILGHALLPCQPQAALMPNIVIGIAQGSVGTFEICYNDPLSSPLSLAHYRPPRSLAG